MIGLKNNLHLTVSGDAAKNLQLLARHYDMRQEDLILHMMTVVFLYEGLSRQGFHLGMAKDVSKLDVHFAGMWT